jgi:hypothetical protein
MLEGQTAGFTADPNQTVADYLTAWLEAKDLVLKPTTMARYHGYVTNDLIPALGDLRLDDLGYPAPANNPIRARQWPSERPWRVLPRGRS